MQEKRLMTAMVSPEHLPDTLAELRNRTLTFEDATATQHLRVSGGVAVELIRAATMAALPNEVVTWAGTTTTTLELANSVFMNLRLIGAIDGDVVVEAPIAGLLRIDGVVTGGIKVNAPISSGLAFGGEVHGRVALHAPVSSIRFNPKSHLGGDVFIYGAETLESVIVERGAKISGHFRINKEVAAKYVTVAGTIERSAAFAGTIEDSLTFTPNSRIGQVIVTGSVGRVGHPDSGAKFNGSTTQTVELHADGDDIIQVASLHGGQFAGPVQLGDGVTLASCEFRNFTDFDKLQLLGAELFARDDNGRQTIKANTHVPALSNAELATTYRRLRRGLEEQGDRPASADFYYGECEARRQDARSHLRSRWSEYAVLTLYRSVSGYGTRALRSVGWFALIAVAASLLFALGGVDLTDAHAVKEASFGSGWSMSERIDLLLFSIRSMVSFFSPPQGQLTTAEQALQLTLRFIGPVLVAQAVLAVRERVAR